MVIPGCFERPHDLMAEYTASCFFPRSPADHKLAYTKILRYPVFRLRSSRGVAPLTAYIQLAWTILIGKLTDATDVEFGLTLWGSNGGSQNVSFRFHISEDEKVEQALASIQAATFGSSENALSDFHFHLNIEEEWNDEIELCYPPPSGVCSLVVTCCIHGGSSAKDMPDLQFIVHYDTRIMETVEVLRMLHQFKHILYQLLEALQTRLRELDLVSPEDWLTLRDWNARLPRASKVTLHELALYHGGSQPAIAAWDGSMTYHQLNRASLGVAQHLLHCGVCPGMFIPFCLEKSKWSVLTILAILRVGGIWVPIDPNTPIGRAREMIEGMGAQFVVASAAQRHKMEQLGPRLLVVSDSMASTDAANCIPLPEVHPEDLAMVLFTSGTTGRPKGMQVHHENIATAALAILDMLNIDSTTRALHFASYSFDLAMYEMICTLHRGACLCIPSESERLDDVTGFMREQKISWAAFTPSSFSLLRPGDLPDLRTVALAGEAIPPSLVQAWTPHVQLVNVYGPTESSVCSAGPIPQHGWRAGTIGPMLGGIGWITDPTDTEKLVPIGAIGELLVEGPGITGGYLNRPSSRSAEVFIDAPSWLRRFRLSPGSAQVPGRLYRTGDLVRYTSLGWIQFVGRQDTQIKIRGQRVELGEVEHRVQEAFPSAPRAVVESVSPSAGRPAPILVAFIPIQQDDTPLEAESTLLCEHSSEFEAQVITASTRLQESLPIYMIPSLFVPVRYLPRTITAKTDRAQLRQLVINRPWRELQRYRPAPRCPCNRQAASSITESKELRILVSLVADVLTCDIEDIRTEDSFLSLGGDSLSAMELVGLARKAGLTLSVLSVLQTRSLQELPNSSAALQQSLTDGLTGQAFSQLRVDDPKTFLAHLVSRLSPQTVEIEDIEDVLPATPRQEYLSDFPCEYLLLRLQGSINHARLQQSCKRLVHYHPILRTVFIRSGDIMHQVVLRHPAVALHVQSPKTDTKEDVNTSALQWCQADSLLPVDPSKLSVHLVLVQGTTQDDNVLVLRYSRSLFDPETIPIVYRGLQQLYEGHSPPPAVSFPAFMYHALSQDLTAEFSFWRHVLQNAEMTQLPPSTNPDPNPQILLAPLPLPTIRPPAGITAATVVKAAWALVLAEQTGLHEIVFTQVVSGRSMPITDIQNVVGPCNRILPVRVSIDDSRDGLLQQIHTQHIDSLPFQGVYLRDIIQHCTSWPADTTMGSIVLHQNIEYPKSFAMGDLQCTPSYFNAPPRHMPVTVVSMPQETGHLIFLTCSSDCATQVYLDALRDSMGRHIAALLKPVDL
ncbi:hypothetical protein BDV37DRAFT_279601 [Aspergillus pseudonomiae]|uniref:Carrier domain-containing protein n=1 Tax=Aspergillus pseudonomiae TaxID=1506151 RepID=A0A5N7DNC6_9EURO|nr:uncharacterized protein BDV37DRAFT_279601 [Aspergillus pseudonomiae]KAE8407815.1 hypothetical protein BDV37DRAFT_279601 [Aspergillus pseudonomiae]